MAKTQQFEHGAAIAWMFPSMVQVRLEGRAILYPSALPSSTSASDDAKALAGTFPQGVPEADPQWWEDKRRDLWNALSSELRASFSRPKPGMQLQDDPENWVDELVRHLQRTITDLSPRTTRETMRRPRMRCSTRGRTLPCLRSSPSP